MSVSDPWHLRQSVFYLPLIDIGDVIIIFGMMVTDLHVLTMVKSACDIDLKDIFKLSFDMEFELFVVFNFYTIILASCTFEDYHNKRYTATDNDIIQKLHVRGAQQCKLKCKAYNGLCSSVNLRYSKESADFICELLKVNTIQEKHLHKDTDCTFMSINGKCNDHC